MCLYRISVEAATKAMDLDNGHIEHDEGEDVVKTTAFVHSFDGKN